MTGASTASPEEFNMRQFNLLTGVSVCALAFAFTAAGNAQEALPEIDVGAATPAPAAAPRHRRRLSSPTNSDIRPSRSAALMCRQASRMSGT